MFNLMVRNNHALYPYNYQPPFYNPIKDSFHSPSKNIININSNPNKNSFQKRSQSPIVPSIFPFSRNNRQNINYTPRTPSPPHLRRNIIDLSDNRKFKESSNSPIVYRNLNRIDSINDSPLITPRAINNISQIPINQTIDNNKKVFPLYKNSPAYINLNKNVFRLTNTPNPKNKNINNINLRKYNQHYSNYINNSINWFDSLETNKYDSINNFNKTSRIINQIPNMLNKNELKTQNNMIIKRNNINLFHNNKNKLKNIVFFNNHNNNKSKSLNNIHINNNNYQNNINIIKFNNINRNNEYTNSIDMNPISDNNKNYNYQNNMNSINYNYQNSIESEKNNNITLNNKNKNIININNNNNQNDYNHISIDISKDIINNNKKISRNQKYKFFVNHSKHYYYSERNRPAITFDTTPIINNNIQPNHINLIQVPKNKHHFLFGEKGIIKKSLNEMKNINPGDDFNPLEFKIIQLIGEGSFGKIYSVKWSKNNQLYAMKKLYLMKDELFLFKQKVKIVKDLVKITGHNGFTKIYGDKAILQKDTNEYNYYIIMELGDRDWLKELKMREGCLLFYTENELFDIVSQLVKSLSIMQKNNVTHRDIKPHNILLFKENYKLCDFGEAKIISGNCQSLLPIGGSELYMSPILYYGVKEKKENVLHNTYKSDVFSLGMCILLAAGFSRKLLCEIRELKDMNSISNIIYKVLINKYSKKLINLIIKMLQIDENLRFDFIELEKYISNILQS